MAQKTSTLAKELRREERHIARAQCRHYWIIEAAESRLSKGECILCGEHRAFPNYLSDCLLNNDREKFEEWVANQGRKKKEKGKADWVAVSETEEGVCSDEADRGRGAEASQGREMVPEEER